MLTALWMFLPIVGAIVINTLVWKLSAKILRYSGVTWPLSLLVAATLIFASLFVRGVLTTSGLHLPNVTMLILGTALPVVLGAWCFHDRAMTASGELVGWPGALRLSALSVALSVLVTGALVFALFTFSRGLSGTLS